MKKLMIAVFAHPDDEAFGPSGTLLKLRDEGYDIHLILLTDGEAGANPDNLSDLGKARLDEWQSSADLIGARTATALHYPDGRLEHSAPETLDETVAPIITAVLATYDQVELSFMTFEPRGFTGHRDHIAVSHLVARMAAQFTAHQTWYFCLGANQAPLDDTAYYEPRAREDSYITARIDISSYRAQKHRVIDAHHTQRADAKIMKKLGDTTEHFHIDSF